MQLDSVSQITALYLFSAVESITFLLYSSVCIFMEPGIHKSSLYKSQLLKYSRAYLAWWQQPWAAGSSHCCQQQQLNYQQSFGGCSGTNMGTIPAIWADRGPCSGDNTTSTKCPGLLEIRLKHSYFLKQDSCTQSTGSYLCPFKSPGTCPRNCSGWYWLVVLASPKQWKSSN